MDISGHDRRAKSKSPGLYAPEYAHYLCLQSKLSRVSYSKINKSINGQEKGCPQLDGKQYSGGNEGIALAELEGRPATKEHIEGQQQKTITQSGISTQPGNAHRKRRRAK